MAGALPLTPPPGGDTPLYLPYRYVPFCSENGYKRSYFGLNSAMVFAAVHERTYLSFQFQMNKKETVICEFEVDFNKSFCWRSNLSKDNIISAYARSENECGK